MAPRPSPEVISELTITKVRITPQVTMWIRPFGLSSPAAAIVLMINTAEPADVTKQVNNSITIKIDISVAEAVENMKLIIENTG